MKEVSSIINYRGKEIKLVFNLNVMESIQQEYGTVDKWGKLIDNKDGEPDIKALKFGLTEMINEGIDIDNDENGTNEPFMTSKQVGRIITELGLEEASKSLQDAVINSTKDDQLKNA